MYCTNKYYLNQVLYVPHNHANVDWTKATSNKTKLIDLYCTNNCNCSSTKILLDVFQFQKPVLQLEFEQIEVLEDDVGKKRR